MGAFFGRRKSALSRERSLHPPYSARNTVVTVRANEPSTFFHVQCSNGVFVFLGVFFKTKHGNIDCFIQWILKKKLENIFLKCGQFLNVCEQVVFQTQTFFRKYMNISKTLNKNYEHF